MKMFIHSFTSINILKIGMCFILALFFYSCSKQDNAIVPGPQKPMVTALGNPVGPQVSKTIGAAGGTVSSVDGNMAIIIPPGALANDQQITIQKVSNTNAAMPCNVYRLSPHDISFQKPVTITMRYFDDSIKNTVPELLGLVYQDQKGEWYHAAEPAVDKQKHTISVSTTHFSDWGYLAYTYIEPSEVLVDPGAQLDMKVMITLPETELDIPSWDGTPVYQPYEPHSSYFGAWSYAGEGTLSGKGTRAHYQAPNKVPKINPEAVSVEVKMKRKGQFFLVSNITIRTDFHIDYMQVDETEKNGGGLNYPSRLYIYGSFGDDPGAAKRLVKINGGAVTVAYWTAGLIVCDIPAVGPYSSGMVQVTSGNKAAAKLLNDWAVNMYYEQKQSPDGALTKKINLVLHLRGDAEGFLRQGQTPFFSSTDLNTSSRGVIAMPAGTFTTHVSMDACGAYTVSWDPVAEMFIERKKDTDHGDGLYGTVVNKPDGFDVTIRLKATDALTSHRQFVGCRSGGSMDHVKEDIAIEGFNAVVIPLRFTKSASKTTIKAGKTAEKPTSPAAGLYWDAPSYPASEFKINLRWDEAQPKFN
jgi:hypothetical protein